MDRGGNIEGDLIWHISDDVWFFNPFSASSFSAAGDSDISRAGCRQQKVIGGKLIGGQIVLRLVHNGSRS